MKNIFVSAAFDRFSSSEMRFLEEAARLGAVTVCLWTDEAVEAVTGQLPKFPFAERLYALQALRSVARVRPDGDDMVPDVRLPLDPKPDVWAVPQPDDTPEKRAFCDAHGIQYRVITNAEMAGFPAPAPQPLVGLGRKKIVVTGCYDWFHTGHIAFFEEVSALGDLYVVVGNDANLLLLKGEGHPMFPQEERRYICGSIRYVTQALISTGSGWMDAEPEILNEIHPDAYAVNEDGDKPEKQAFCQQHGLEYIVLKREPKEGLSRRSSTDLRGF